MLVYQRVSTRTRMQWVLNSYVLAPYNWGCCRPRKIHHGFTKHRMRLWISRSLRSTQPCTTQTYLGSWAETGMIPEKPGRLTTSKKQPPKWVDFYIIQSYPIISNHIQSMNQRFPHRMHGLSFLHFLPCEQLGDFNGWQKRCFGATTKSQCVRKRWVQLCLLCLLGF